MTDTTVRLDDVSRDSGARITIERRGTIALFGINRPDSDNRFDPQTYHDLATGYYGYNNDPSLRCAILFGHGACFSRGMDVQAFGKAAAAGSPFALQPGQVDPLGKQPHLNKPLVVVVHGAAWNLGHELHLAADIRIASADTDFGQDEATHARMPGGGGTVRFVREAGWGNAMRYMLTGDHWSAEEAFRMGVVQHVAADPAQARTVGLAIAEKIAACGPLGVRMILESAHTVIDPAEAPALGKLDAQYGSLYKTQDFVEGRRAEAEHRRPVFHGR